MKALKFKEIETKYRADNLTLGDFQAFCQGRGPIRSVTAAGYDHFFSSPLVADDSTFARHRIGPDMNQLTFKRKTSDKNNYIRTEHNINLSADTNPDQIRALMLEFGYEFNSTIFKNVFVYDFENYALVYYVCYDVSLKELGRFVEIEMAETYLWDSEKTAWDELLKIEAEAKSLGLSPQRRMRNSLFEMFKR